MPYEISLAQRKVILLKHRIDELIEHGYPIRESAFPAVYLVGDSCGDLTIVDDRSKPDLQSAANPVNGITVKKEQLEHWAEGSVAARVKGKRVLDELVRALWPVPENVKDEDKQHIIEGSVQRLREKWVDDKNPGPITDDDIGRMEFATAIGFTCARARYLLDRAYQTKPSFHVFAMPASKADAFCKVHAGVYFVYRVEDTRWTRTHGYSSGIVLKSVLVMRYPVPYKTFALESSGGKVNKEKKTNYSRIHCKYIIPQISDKEQEIVYKYDGYCAPGRKNNGSWQWLFQQRQSAVNEQQSDILVMYTAAFDGGGDSISESPQWVDGDVLTEYQGTRKGAGKAHLNSPVVIVRVLGYECREVAGSEGKFGSAHIALHRKGMDGNYCVENEHVFMRKNTRILDLSSNDLLSDDYDALAIRRLLARS